jgi:Mn2+/Fe2+ NRAMP family transporter
MDYRRYARVLKWLTLSLFAYVAVVFVVDVHWSEVLRHTLLPDFKLGGDQLGMIVAIFGTTISPYLFFWQAEQEVEEMREHNGSHRLATTPRAAAPEIHRIQLDTYVGMGFSNLIGFFVLVTAAATLHQHGLTDIQTSAQAAEALRPIAGPATMAVFAAGIIGTGLLAVPVLAGSAAFAVGEALRWPVGLGRKPREAKAFYAVIAVATAIGVALNFVGLDPIRALVWAAVVNGVIAVPMMVVMMLMARNARVMGRLTIPPALLVLGWAATLVMAGVSLAMFVTG